jgi:asparagine synthase (glutamine-hydrolysing)
MDVGRDERYLRWVGYFVGALHQEVIGPRLREAQRRPQSELVSLATGLTGAQNATERYMSADSLLALPGDLLVKMDIATMANSLEARSPLLDHELATFMAALPASFKTRGRRTKVLLRHAMRGILPESTLRRGKMGLSAPVAAWFRGPLRDIFGDVVLSRTARERGFVMPVVAERIFRDHLNFRDSRPNLLWNLLVLELWFRECVDSRPPISLEPPRVLSSRS